MVFGLQDGEPGGRPQTPEVMPMLSQVPSVQMPESVNPAVAIRLQCLVVAAYVVSIHQAVSRPEQRLSISYEYSKILDLAKDFETWVLEPLTHKQKMRRDPK